jgi:hypothetical protein
MNNDRDDDHDRLHYQALRQSRRLKRSQVACMACRRRKVRCDFAISGPPCTNCRLDCCPCVTKPREKTRPDHATVKESTPPPSLENDDHAAGNHPVGFRQRTAVARVKSDGTYNATGDDFGGYAEPAESMPFLSSVRGE